MSDEDTGMLLGHILAGLRLLQNAISGGHLRLELEEIARSGEEFPLASVEQIDHWCEQLNVGPLRIINVEEMEEDQ